MKNIIYKTKFLLYAFIMIIFTIDAAAQVVSSDQCTILDRNFSIKLLEQNGMSLTDVESGSEFNLIVSLSKIQNCDDIDVFINTSDNLIHGSVPNTYPYPFVNAGTNRYENGSFLPGGHDVFIPFKFEPGVTCDGELGTFDVNIILTFDDNSTQECSLSVSLRAEAENYWVVEKKHVFGNLSGGVIYWDVIITNTNSNPGIGDYDIALGYITDNFNSGEIISVSGGPPGLPPLPAVTAGWWIGNISSSTTTPIVYTVKTYSCKPAGTVVENCVEYFFCLGKLTHLWPVKCCSIFEGNTCATVTLTGTATTSSNFSKSLTYGNNLNYAQGCEGEYQIVVSNNGNTPLKNITILDDPFPSGIEVTKITVWDHNTGVSMDYNITFSTPPATTPPLPLNTRNNNTWTFTAGSGFPTDFTLTTISGVLLDGYIRIKIRFTITDPAGNLIDKNCALLNYSGTYDGWGNWCSISLPPPGQNIDVERCAPSFTVENPRPIPGIRKWIIPNWKQTYMVDDVIHFRIAVSNHGAASFTGNLTDFLGNPQNLELVPNSVEYSWGDGQFSPYQTIPLLIAPFGNQTSVPPPPPSWLTAQLTTNNLEWSITGMPGNCELDKAFYLTIDFEATVKPQLVNQYCNTANLGTLSSDACYNVIRDARITTTKQVSTEFVEPGQSFDYIIVVRNEGSVALKDIIVEDQLPSCVTYNNHSARKLDYDGNQLMLITNVTWSYPNFTFPSGLTIQPGESVELTITVTRNANDESEQCCNPKAIGIVTSDDPAATTFAYESDPVCVKSGLCCDIENMEVDFETIVFRTEIVPKFEITSGPLPIQEVEISLIDYHVEYNDPNCKPLNMGNLFGHIQPFVWGPYDFNSLPGFSGWGPPFLPLQTVVSHVNNSLTWSADLAPVMFSGMPTGLIFLNFIAPDIVNLDCCSGVVYYCFKVKLTDVNCNVCEKIVCGSFNIQKEGQIEWKNEKLKDLYKLQSLDNKPKFNKEFEQIFKQKFGNEFEQIFKQKYGKEFEQIFEQIFKQKFEREIPYDEDLLEFFKRDK